MTDAEMLRAVADSIKSRCGQDIGFALLLSWMPGVVSYISSANREDVRKLMSEWLERYQEVTPGVCISRWISGDKEETTEANEARLTLEDLCAEIGKTFVGNCSVLLFLFNFGEKGHTAFFTSMRDARAAVEAWLRSGKNAS